MLIRESWGHYLKASFIENQDKIAIIDKTQNARYTYSDLLYKSKEIEKALISNKITRKTHVVLAFPNSATWIATFLALINIGAVPVCLNHESIEAELLYEIEYADAKIIITNEETYKRMCEKEVQLGLKRVIVVDRQEETVGSIDIGLKQFIESGNNIDIETIEKARDSVKYNDILAIQYTSGTTGRPKAVMSEHHKVLNNMRQVLAAFNYKSEDRIFSPLPMYHVMGCFFSCLLPFMVGASIVIMEKFSTEKAIKILSEEGCTSFHGVPTMYKLILGKMKDIRFEALDKGMIAGAYCDELTMKEIIDRMDMRNIMPLYGQSEGCGYTQIREGDPIEKTITTVGRVIDGVEVKIVNDQLLENPNYVQGEILIRSSYFMSGYYKNQDATNRVIIDGWMHTGDMGWLDEAGYLTITGRKKDIIIRGGENISPANIEKSIRACPLIREVVVVGVPDLIMGQEICAFIIVKEDVKKDKVIRDIKTYIEENLSKHKRPKYIRVIEKFPTTGSGKIQKFKLVQMI